MTSDDKRSTAEIRISTGARLHFGLLDTAAPFGGLGVMIDAPQTQIVVSAASQFQCTGDGAERATEIAHRLCRYLGRVTLPACHLEILRRPDPHTGLGTGTQLAMAVADALAEFCEAVVPSSVLARQIADRGKRSAVGVHGYLNGGLIFESAEENSKAASDHLNPIVQRVELPLDWTVVLARSAQLSETVHGKDEQQQFAQLNAASEKQRMALRQLITDRIVPSAASGDFEAFAGAIHHYNHQSGMLFSPVQGGPYNGPQITHAIELLHQHGAKGVGQSSWGPSVFCWFPSRVDAEGFVNSLSSESLIIDIAGVQNQPAAKT